MRPADAFRAFGLSGFGVAGVLAALAAIVVDPRAGLTGWLAAAVLLQAVPLGALVLLATMRLVPGRWESELREACEAAAGLWCFAALAFVPVLLGATAIYDWTRVPAESAFQGAWLGLLPFVLRTCAWFVALAVIARSQVGGRASQGASALALIVMTLGASVLAVDWFMSLDMAFHASGFGLTLFALQVCAAYLVILLLRLAYGRKPRRRAAKAPGLLGGLLIMFLLLWLYFQFMPFLVAWSGNLPDKAAWYLLRGEGGWGALLYAAGLLGGVPLLAMLLPRYRRSPRALALAAICALVGKGLEFAWFALPGRGAVAVLAHGFALCGLGCLAAGFLAPDGAWGRALKRRAA